MLFYFKFTTEFADKRHEISQLKVNKQYDTHKQVCGSGLAQDSDPNFLRIHIRIQQDRILNNLWGYVLLFIDKYKFVIIFSRKDGTKIAKSLRSCVFILKF